MIHDCVSVHLKPYNVSIQEVHWILRGNFPCNDVTPIMPPIFKNIIFFWGGGADRKSKKIVMGVRFSFHYDDLCWSLCAFAFNNGGHSGLISLVMPQSGNFRTTLSPVMYTLVLFVFAVLSWLEWLAFKFCFVGYDWHLKIDTKGVQKTIVFVILIGYSSETWVFVVYLISCWIIFVRPDFR